MIGLVATVAFAWSAAAIENAEELAGYCQSLERGAEGAGRHIYIPSTREALTCWGYMQAMQNLSVLADENGHRIMGACPPEQTTTLQLARNSIQKIPVESMTAVSSMRLRAAHGNSFNHLVGAPEHIGGTSRPLTLAALCSNSAKTPNI